MLGGGARGRLLNGVRKSKRGGHRGKVDEHTQCIHLLLGLTTAANDNPFVNNLDV